MKKKQETSYGIIPLKLLEGHWQVLLIKHQAGHWSFPKGHPEVGESSLDSAKRELSEETGLQVTKILRETPIKEQYRFQREGCLIEKSVEYFLAEVDGEITIQAEEIAESRWVLLSNAAKQVTFPEGKRICSETLNLLLGRNQGQ